MTLSKTLFVTVRILQGSENERRPTNKSQSTMNAFRTANLLLLALFGLLIDIGYSDTSVNNTEAKYTCWDDASFAIISQQLSDRLGDKQAFYNDFLDGCHEAAGDHAKLFCDSEENWRMQMNMYQPRSMVNFTKTGILKTRAPPDVFRIIKEFWELNKNKAEVEWKRPTPYHNNWDTPPTILRVDHRYLPRAGPHLQAVISNAARDMVEAWTGQRLASTSVYGIRIYHNQSILAPHVDRLPLVSSAIINVDQDVDEPWYLEVYDHDGVAHNVSMEPGDMVLYESHSVIHGRPFPLQGKFYANIFVHFEAIGPLDGEHVENGDLPPYLLEGSSWEPEWRSVNQEGWKLLKDPRTLVIKGDYNVLEYLAKVNPAVLHKADENGWRPIHEACRQGYLDMVKLFVENGADIYEKTRIRHGMDALDIAREFLEPGHPATMFLERKVSAEKVQHDDIGRMGVESRTEL